MISFSTGATMNNTSLNGQFTRISSSVPMLDGTFSEARSHLGNESEASRFEVRLALPHELDEVFALRWDVFLSGNEQIIETMKDVDDFDADQAAPGCNCPDAPLEVAGRPAWLLDQLGGGFVVLVFGECAAEPTQLSVGRVCPALLRVGHDLQDIRGLLAARYDARPGTTYLIRPDQYVAARWRSFEPAK
ncbi:hypothetical protein EBR21_17800, partial [bacterium]|nr:hypothetical protein [bacterium]